MNKIIKKIAYTAVVALGLTSCNSEDVTYTGSQFVMFADSTFSMPVFENDSVFEIDVVSSSKSSVDRNYAVDVVTSGSTAIRGFHYDFVDGSNNVTIKAGENKTSIKIRSYYKSINYSDSIVLKLELLAPKEEQLAGYANNTAVNFFKCPTFIFEEFFYPGNYLKMYASFPLSDATSIYYRESNIYVDSEQIIIKGLVAKGFDIKAIFDNSDPVSPRIIVPEQRLFKDVNYGDVYCRTVDAYPSFFLADDKLFAINLELYVPQIGSFGVYQYLFKCITEDEYLNQANGVS